MPQILPVLKQISSLAQNQRTHWLQATLCYRLHTKAPKTTLSVTWHPFSIRSSSVVILARSSTSSLKITKRSFRYASPLFLKSFLIHSASLAQINLLQLHLVLHVLVHHLHRYHFHHPSPLRSPTPGKKHYLFHKPSLPQIVHTLLHHLVNAYEGKADMV